jgi:hypothetical protein
MKFKLNYALALFLFFISSSKKSNPVPERVVDWIEEAHRSGMGNPAQM